jgi:acetylornithine deacetylase/succinyl-diaminopimelate desuccinylase-like protein
VAVKDFNEGWQFKTLAPPPAYSGLGFGTGPDLVLLPEPGSLSIAALGGRTWACRCPGHPLQCGSRSASTRPAMHDFDLVLTLTAALTASVRAVQKRSLALPSGAGHDAVVMSALTPVAMLFVRSRAGLSHHPDEFSSPADIAVALDVLIDFIERLARNYAS